jgi:hypothetical protein
MDEKTVTLAGFSDEYSKSSRVAAKSQWIAPFVHAIGYKYGGGSPKFIWAPCASDVHMLYSLAETTQAPPRIGTRIRGRYWSAKIDDISL